MLPAFGKGECREGWEVWGQLPPAYDALRTSATAAIIHNMRTYWLIVLTLAFADAAVAALLLLKDGGPEALVWLTFLIMPLVIAALVVVGVILQLVLCWSSRLRKT